jgi:hypothetical protein
VREPTSASRWTPSSAISDAEICDWNEMMLAVAD